MGTKYILLIGEEECRKIDYSELDITYLIVCARLPTMVH